MFGFRQAQKPLISLSLARRAHHSTASKLSLNGHRRSSGIYRAETLNTYHQKNGLHNVSITLPTATIMSQPGFKPETRSSVLPSDYVAG
jgi:hypothetical protein